jgi:phosphoglycolate phosphatase
MKPVPAPALLIDMDGTLLDSLPDLASAVNHALAAMGRPVRPLDEVRAFVGQGASTLVRRAMAGGTAAEIDRALEFFFAHYTEHCLDTTRPYPGWEAVLASDLTLVCATNKPERFARALLDGLGLAPRFRLLVGGDTLAVKKPDPAVAAHIAARLGVAASQFIMIGDGLADAELAHNAGFPFWAAAWGYVKPGELESLASAWLTRPEDILRQVA